ncbi:MAG: hypothetical protein J7K59_07140 [Candidatus Korarchaeota archaeon]|nr:hypothetical protein [Candidatus Korarchaeota archaeon]
MGGTVKNPRKNINIAPKIKKAKSRKPMSLKGSNFILQYVMKRAKGNNERYDVKIRTTTSNIPFFMDLRLTISITKSDLMMIKIRDYY